jgi:peptidase M28-like protein
MHRILLSLASLAVVICISLQSVQPPAPRPTSAPPTEFSAGRAREVLSRLVGDGVPHQVGSAADDVVRSRVIVELTNLGYQPDVQTGFACDEYGTCATANNVLARLDGSETISSGAVLVAAHYDSVPAGPGASDDGAGVATVLEIARALKSLPKPRHPVIFLIDEGEEAGLIGAHVFVDRHPWAKEVRAAVNIDARGSSGPSLMFETGSADEWAVRLYAKHAAHPATSSIFYAAYKQLPNDTDFTVFKAAGYEGVNFAFIGDVAHYHTQIDNFANANPASLQHHGDNALPMVVAFANSNLSSLPQREAVFFDVFERWTVWWPASWTLFFPCSAAILLLLQIAWLVRNKRLAPGAMAWGLTAWFGIVLITAGAATLLRWLLGKTAALPVNWVAHPIPVEIAFWSLAFVVVVCIAYAFASRAGFWGLWTGVWLGWTLTAVAVAWLEPGMSYIFVVPLWAAALAGLPSTLRGSEAPSASAVAVVLPLLVAGVLGFALLFFLYDGMGIHALVGVAVLLAVFLSPLAPLVPDLQGSRAFWRLAFLGGAVGVLALAIFVAAVAPAYSAKSPERVNIEYWLDGDSGKAQWMVRPDSGRLSEPIRVATNFQRLSRGPLPWYSRPAFLADAPHLGLAAPTFTILESTLAGDKHAYRALLRSERGASDAMVLFPPDAGIESVRMEGEPMQTESPRVKSYVNRWSFYDCVTMPAKGVEISFTLPAGKPIEIYAVDQSYELPLEGLFLQKSRPFTARPSQDGDVTIVSRRVQLIP